MQKGISESKVQRMRNLLTKKHNAKTKIQTGYNKKNVIRKEGDIWEEGGKTWTIKNGITKTVSKMYRLREICKVPLFCPKSGKPMKGPNDIIFYRLYGMSYDSYIYEKTMKRVDKEEFVKNNLEEWKTDSLSELNDIEKSFNTYIESSDVSYITETGKIEDWQGGIDKKKLKDDFYEKLEVARKNIQDTTTLGG